MKPRATFHWPWLLFWCTVGALLWLAAIAGLRSLGLAPWQVLCLSRLWLHDNLPHNSETCTIGKTLKLVQRRWLEVHPPRDLNQPYHVRKIISYADTRYHNGTIYRAANFREAGHTQSRKRHKNTRGPGMDGAELIRFVYDLPRPRWEWRTGMGLPLFEL